jgi:hypothetical protein
MLFPFDPSKNGFKILISLKDGFEAISSAEMSGCIRTIGRYNTEDRTSAVETSSAANAFRFREEMASISSSTNSNYCRVRFIDDRDLKITYLRSHPVKIKFVHNQNKNNKYL